MTRGFVLAPGIEARQLSRARGGQCCGHDCDYSRFASPPSAGAADILIQQTSTRADVRGRCIGRAGP